MAERHDQAREDLRAWQQRQPLNFFSGNRQLQRLIGRLMGDDAARHGEHLRHFGAVAAGALDAAATENNLNENLPRLERWSAIGERVESVAHHPSYDACGKAIYEDGRIIAVYAEPPANLYAQTVFYVSSHAGEAGHNCPVACTAGVVKALAAEGSDELKARYLPKLLTNVYAERFDGAQFLTEVQGGSDVGANAVRAVPDGEGFGTSRWRIHGEKWFCSNADADLILMTARVEGGPGGTRGLGLFLVPRVLEDGSVNRFSIRRLKDKLGTRSMPSGEMDFEGAVGYAVGPVERGFQTVMQQVITTSRLYNTVGCAGIARRAFEIADAYARTRRAFGQPIAEFPLVQEMIASLRGQSQALAAGALELAWRFDELEAGRGSEAERAFARVATNFVKLRSCQHSHRAVLTAIETLGGNGAIESFSILPRLLRDNVVYENWEGTHNVLVAQTVRDFGRLKLHEGFFEILDARLEIDAPELREALAPARMAVERAKAALPEILGQADPGIAGLMLRPHVEALADAYFAAALAHDVASEADAERRAAETQLVAWYCAEWLGEKRPARDVAYADRARTVSALEG